MENIDKQPNKKKKVLIITLITIVILILIMIIGFNIYVSDYYRSEVSLSDFDNYDVIDNFTILKTDIPTDTAMIFYPGALVEHTAYLPILDNLRENGIMCVLVEMPYHMAIFGVKSAEPLFDMYPEITNWYMSGHSMGGGMASSYSYDVKDKIQGLILMGAYVYGDYPPEKSLTIYGTFNSNLEEKINYTENIVIIEGGNHAWFGNYGVQEGDPPATITHQEQQDITVNAILEFIGKS